MVMRIGSTQKELTVSLFTLLFIFTTVFCPGEFLPWECRVPFPGERQLRQSRATQPSVNAEYLCFRNPPNSDMDYRIFNVHKHVNACDCTRGCTDTVRESVLKVDSGRKIPCCTGESAACRSHAVPADLHHGTFMAKFTINLREVRALVPCYPHGQSCLHSKVHN